MNAPKGERVTLNSRPSTLSSPAACVPCLECTAFVYRADSDECSLKFAAGTPTPCEGCFGQNALEKVAHRFRVASDPTEFRSGDRILPRTVMPSSEKTDSEAT